MKKTPYSEKDLKYFSKILKKEKKEIDEELAGIEQLLNDQQNYVASTEMDFGSDASKIRNEEMLKNMQRRMKDRQKDYADALKKIKKGTYGICEKTGKKISKQRLLALPAARTCIRMKTK